MALCLLMATSVFAADNFGLENFMLNWFMYHFRKAEINDSFINANGVANANVAAGNLNNQVAGTTISFGGSGSGFAAKAPSIFQGYAGTFIVDNSVFGQGIIAQFIYPENNRVVVQQTAVGFIVDARHTSDHVTISRSFQGYKGVATVTQAAGNLNNQVAMAAVVNGSLSSVHSRGPLLVYSNISDNLLMLDKHSSFKAVIDGGSFRNYSGMLALSQTAGNLNSTVNFVGVSLNASPEKFQALDNLHLSDITAISKKNEIVSEGKGKGERPEAKIEHGAFQNFNGIASITQVAGNMNQVSTQVGVNVH